MLSVKTNRSIEDFKSDVVGGFNLIETVTIVGCVIVYAIIMMILILYSPIPKILCAYVPFPLIVYPIAKTFFKKNGMGIKEFRAKTKAFKSGEILPYKSTEIQIIILILQKNQIVRILLIRHCVKLK